MFYLSWWISYTISSELGITFDPNLQIETNNFGKSIRKVGEYSLASSFSFIKWPGDTINWKISDMSRSEELLLPHITWGRIFWGHSCCLLPLRARPHIQGPQLPRMSSPNKQLAWKMIWVPNLASCFANNSSFLPVRFWCGELFRKTMHSAFWDLWIQIKRHA